MSVPLGQVLRNGPADGAGLVPAPALAAQLRRAIVLLRRRLRRQSPSELTVSQLSVLATVVRAGPLGVGQLAEAEVLPSPTVTRLADKLEQAGLICRRANPADRRGVLLGATEAGRELMARREQASDAWLAECLEALPRADRLALERAAQVLGSLAGGKGADQEVPT